MKTFYQIVPVNDGYRYISKDEKGNHILLAKENISDKKVMFNTKEEAQAYIEKHFNPSKYEVEELWLDAEHFKL